MTDLSWLFHLASLFPLDGMDMRFMQQALVALVLLAPMTAALGVQVVYYRMAFFSDAVGHSAFAGVAIGLVLTLDRVFSMPLFGLAVGLVIMFMQRFSALPSDTVIGVVFSAVVAGGLAVVSRNNTIARDLQQFLYGDILTMTETDICWLLALFVLFVIFQACAFNRLLYAGTSGIIARRTACPWPSLNTSLPPCSPSWSCSRCGAWACCSSRPCSSCPRPRHATSPPARAACSGGPFS